MPNINLDKKIIDMIRYSTAVNVHSPESRYPKLKGFVNASACLWAYFFLGFQLFKHLLFSAYLINLLIYENTIPGHVFTFSRLYTLRQWPVIFIIIFSNLF